MKITTYDLSSENCADSSLEFEDPSGKIKSGHLWRYKATKNNPLGCKLHHFVLGTDYNTLAQYIDEACIIEMDRSTYLTRLHNVKEMQKSISPAIEDSWDTLIQLKRGSTPLNP